ncbi:MAG: aromatic ring-opening dioxygenase subunit LigA [Burkholderiales bacterium]
MSLYSVQKVLFQMNKDAATRARFKSDRDALLAEYTLTEEERRSLAEADVGRLHLMGVHPLLLAPFAGRSGLKWPDYLATLQRARDANAGKTKATADERR